MHFTDLEVPEFDHWHHPVPLQKAISAALNRGFDPRGDVYDLKPVIENDLAKIKKEHGYEYTTAQINYKLHDRIRLMCPKELDCISLDRDNRIYQCRRYPRSYVRSFIQMSCDSVIQDDEYELDSVRIDNDTAEWRVYAVPAADWTDDDFGLITIRGEPIMGIKRNGPKKQFVMERITTSTRQWT